MGKTTIIRTGDFIGTKNSQIVIGIEIKIIANVSTLSDSNKKELVENLIDFRKEISTLGLPVDDQIILNGKVTEIIKEADKENQDLPKIKGLYKSAIDTIKGFSNAVEKVASSETIKRISELLGLTLSIIK